MGQVGLDRPVAPEDLQGGPLEALAEGEVDLGGAALGPGGDQPAIVEDLSGGELAAAEEGGGRLPHRPHQGVELGEGVGRLLEDDVLRRPEHPVREVAGLELGERHRHRDPHVLDPADPAGPHLGEQAGEGGLIEIVVIDPQGEAALQGELTQLARRLRIEGDGLFDQGSNPQLEEPAGDRNVEVGRGQHVGDLDSQAGELLDRGDGLRHPELVSDPLGAGAIDVGHRDDLYSLESAEDFEVEAGDIASADDGDADGLAGGAEARCAPVARPLRRGLVKRFEHGSPPAGLNGPA